MKNNIMAILAVIIVAALAVTVGAHYLMDDEEGHKIIGTWIMVESCGYENGEFHKYDQSPEYNLHVYGIKDGIFYGEYGGEKVTGTYLNGKVLIQQVVNGVQTKAHGVIMDDVMYLNDSYLEEGGYTGVSVMTKSGEIPDRGGTIVLPTSEMKMDSLIICHDYWTIEDYSDSVSLTFRITEQTRSVFMGEFVVTSGSESITVPVSGAAHRTYDGVITGSFVTDSGVYCDMRMTSDWTIIESAYGITNAHGMEIILFSGEADMDILPKTAGLGYTTWVNEGYRCVDEDGNSTWVSRRNVLMLSDMDRYLANASIDINGELYPMTMCIYDRNGTFRVDAVIGHDGTAVFDSGWLNKDLDEMTLRFSYIVDGKNCSAYAVYKLQVSDKIGNWVPVYGEGYDENNRYVVLDGLDDYSIEIGEDTGNVIYGSIGGKQFSSTVLDNGVYSTFVSSDDGSAYIYGMISDNVISCSYFAVADGDKGYSAYRLVYLKEGTTADYSEDFKQIDGVELMLSTYDCEYDGIKDRFDKQNLKVIEQNGPAVLISAEVYYVDEPMMITMKGILYGTDGADGVFLRVFDGNYPWNLTISEDRDSAVMSCAANNGNSTMASVRTYVSVEGAEVTVPVPDVNGVLGVTYSVSSMDYLYSDGYGAKWMMDLDITFTEAHRSLICGTFVINGESYAIYGILNSNVRGIPVIYAVSDFLGPNSHITIHLSKDMQSGTVAMYTVMEESDTPLTYSAIGQTDATKTA